jgi:hypothetical protein
MYFDPGGGEDRMDVNVRGFAAELAAHRVTGAVLNWDYLPEDYRRKDKPPDLGRRTEVRNAKSHQGRLWASKADPATNVFLLVTGTVPTFRIRGWVEGSDLKIADRREMPPAVRYPGFFIDALDLNPLPLPEDA